jgi:hypothetical protein
MPKIVSTDLGPGFFRKFYGTRSTSLIGKAKDLYSRGRIGFQKSVELDITPALEGIDDVEAFLDRVSRLVTTDLGAMARAGAEAIQLETLRRLVTDHTPGPFVTQGYKIAKGQVAIDQFVERIFPLLFLEPKVMYGSRGTITLGIFDLEKLAEIKISDIVQMQKSPKYSDAGITEKAAMQDRATIKGGAKSGRRTRINNSPYVHTWQIIEFGTGIFAQHPEWGWGPREEGPTKVPGGGGAWRYGQNPGFISLGQKGGHFMFGVREEVEFARRDYEVALAAITTYLNVKLGLEVVEQPAAKGTKRRAKG